MELAQNPVASLGEAVLLISLVAAAYAGSACAVGARNGSRRLVDSGLYATYAVAGLLSFASALMFFAILSNDYSIKYVQHYSDATMPWFYKLTSYWGGLDGSMMFWAWLLSGFAAVAVLVNRERHRELVPWVSAILMGILCFFLVLLIYQKRPFDTYLTEAPGAGKGLNPLLQNPYMATHPPSLYIGLVSAAVPFAFGMAALITGNLDDSWLRSVRRWVLLSWFFLSLGLTLGMLWAYEVLGWGGYWGWDPVENAGSLAWFTSTAFLHSVIVQERRGMLKIWNVFLVLTSFLLTMVATFLTRSGFVQSVHAFGSDPVLKVAFLAFIGFGAVLGYGLLIYRIPLLRSRGTLDSWVSREFAFMVNNWILLACALFILIATIFPSLSEGVTGVRVNLATPFYTQWMAPIGLVLLFLTGVGPLIAWRRATPQNLVEQFAFPAGAGAVTVAVLAFIPGMAARTAIFSQKVQLPVALVCFGLCAFVSATVAQEFYRGARVRQSHTRLDFFTSLVGLVARNKRRYGGYLIHIAVVFMFLGYAGGAYKQETEVTLERGQQAQLGQYQIRFLEFRTLDTVEKKIIEADMAVFVGGKQVGTARPAKWYFPHHEEEPVTKVEISRSLKEDLYLVLNGFDAQQGLANLKIVVNPLVNWIWMGFMLLAIGTAIVMTPDKAYALAEQAAASAPSGGGPLSHKSATLLLLFGFFLVGQRLGLERSARADEPPMMHDPGKTIVAAPRSPDESELFRKIVCMCGTCGRQLLSDCTCSTAAHMRESISKMLSDGKTKDQVIAYYLDKYPGQSALAMPLDGGFNRLAWMFPYAAMLAGAGGLVMVARRSTRRSATAPVGESAADHPNAAAPAATDDPYQDRLDDELDELD